MRKLLFVLVFAVAAGPVLAQDAISQAADAIVQGVQKHLEEKYPGNTDMYNTVSERLLLCGGIYSALAQRAPMKNELDRQRLQIAGQAFAAASKASHKGSEADYDGALTAAVEDDLSDAMNDKAEAAALLQNCQAFTDPAKIEGAMTDLN